MGVTGTKAMTLIVLSLVAPPHRDVSFRRRRSLSFMISLKSAAGRISFVPNFMPGCCEIS